MVAIKNIAFAGFAMAGMIQSAMAYAPAETPMDIGVRSVLAEPAGGMSEVDKRFWGLALKAGRKLVGAGIKAVKGRRDLEENMEVRDIVDAIALPIDFHKRYIDEDLPLEVRAVLDGSHPDVTVMDKRFWGLALKAGRKLVGAGIKAVKGRRDLEDEMVLEARDILDDTPVVEFQLRNLDEDLPVEVRAVMDGSHPDLTVVNKRFWGLALKAGRKLVGAGIKAAKGRGRRDLEDLYEEAY